MATVRRGSWHSALGETCFYSIALNTLLGHAQLEHLHLLHVVVLLLHLAVLQLVTILCKSETLLPTV